jgi:hypothetical protein
MRAPSGIVASLLIGALATGGAGCSFAFSGGPPTDHALMPYFDCPSTYGMPVADGFFGLSGVAGAAQALSQSKEKYAARNDGANRDAVVAVNFVVAGVFAASAIYGIVQAERCRRAKAALEARILAPILRPLPPPPAPTAPAPPPAPVPPPPAPLPPEAPLSPAPDGGAPVSPP